MNLSIAQPIKLLVAALLIQLSSFAQNDIAGTWVLESKQHIAGKEYINALAKEMTISFQKDSLVIEMVSDGGRGKELSEKWVLPVNEQPKITITRGKRVETLIWNKAKTGFVLKREFYYNMDFPDGVTLTRVESWELSPDSKQLTIDRKSIETQSQDWQVKGLYFRSQTNH